MPAKRNTSLPTAAKKKSGDNTKPRAKHHSRNAHPDAAKHALADSLAAPQPTLTDPLNSISHEEIALLAYASWELRGRPVGSAEYDWIKAEQELRSRHAIS